MKIDTLMNVLEVLIMVSDTPLPADKLCTLVDHNDVTIKEVKTALEELANIYEGRGIGLKKVGSGYRFQAREEYQQWFHKLFTEKPAKYSRALLETLAIIAYRQPVTRADVEGIRGVAVSTSIMRTLLEREWVKVVGHRDVPGKPSIYATTKIFLDYFNIEKLDDLPPLSEVKALADIMEQGKQSEISLKEAQQTLPLEEGEEEPEKGLEVNTEAHVMEALSSTEEGGTTESIETIVEPVTEGLEEIDEGLALEHSLSNEDDDVEIGIREEEISEGLESNAEPATDKREDIDEDLALEPSVLNEDDAVETASILEEEAVE